MAGITTEDVYKSYAGRGILNGLSFRAPCGSVTLLAGLNGAGKTTWMRAALGLARADAGDIRFNGDRLAAARRHIGVVLDEPPIYPALSAEENLYALSGGVPRGTVGRARVLESLAIDPELLKLRGRALSLGQRRRISVAAALLRRPRFLFLDEPTVGLDPMAWGLVAESLRSMVEGGCAVVLTGQDFGQLITLVSHVAVLKDGISIFDGGVDALTATRPPRVWFETSDPAVALPDGWERAGLRGGGMRGERVCESVSEAQVILDQVRGWGGALSGLGIRTASVEEAFLAIVGPREGGHLE